MGGCGQRALLLPAAQRAAAPCLARAGAEQRGWERSAAGAAAGAQASCAIMSQLGRAARGVNGQAAGRPCARGAHTQRGSAASAGPQPLGSVPEATGAAAPSSECRGRAAGSASRPASRLWRGAPIGGCTAQPCPAVQSPQHGHLIDDQHPEPAQPAQPLAGDIKVSDRLLHLPACRPQNGAARKRCTGAAIGTAAPAASTRLHSMRRALPRCRLAMQGGPGLAAWCARTEARVQRGAAHQLCCLQGRGSGGHLSGKEAACHLRWRVMRTRMRAGHKGWRPGAGAQGCAGSWRTPVCQRRGCRRLAWPVSAVSAYSTPMLSNWEVTWDMSALLPAGCAAWER